MAFNTLQIQKAEPDKLYISNTLQIRSVYIVCIDIIFITASGIKKPHEHMETFIPLGEKSWCV